MARSTGSAGRTRGWTIGRAAGAPIVLTPGWLVAATVLTVLAVPLARSADPTAPDLAVYLLAFSGVVLLFVSTFLHELAHAVVARREGIRVEQIAITLLGGHTQLGGEAPTAGASARVAVAGPVTNLALAVAAYLLWQVLAADGVVGLLALAAALTNAFVGVFNFVPGLPLDGGRVLEAGVWRLTGRRSTGTRVAAWVGRATAVAVAAWAVLPLLVDGAPPDLTRIVWGALIGSTVWSGAGHALRHARSQDAAAALSVRALMVPAVALPATDTLADLDLLAEPGAAVVVLGPGGTPTGYVDLAAADAVPAALRAATGLAAVTVPLPPDAVVGAGLTGSDAVAAVAQASRAARVMAVVDSSGAVVGLLHWKDVVGALRLGT